MVCVCVCSVNKQKCFSSCLVNLCGNVTSGVTWSDFAASVHSYRTGMRPHTRSSRERVAPVNSAKLNKDNSRTDPRAARLMPTGGFSSFVTSPASVPMVPTHRPVVGTRRPTRSTLRPNPLKANCFRVPVRRYLHSSMPPASLYENLSVDVCIMKRRI